MTAYRELSLPMRFFLWLGLDSVAWSLRRLWCPVARTELVLEVGSGGNPYFRANVLLDAYEETRERHWAPLVSDRPTVLGFVEKLPFRDKCFDFVIASHVLEHSAEPERFLNELQRVARAGYIEVPDAFMERINPYHDHRLEVTARDGTLLIRKKPAWRNDPELVELYEDRAKAILTGETMRKHPFQFHVRFYWRDTIPFEVLNPETDAAWRPDTGHNPSLTAAGLRARFAGYILSLARLLFSQGRRNRALDLKTLLACPACKSAELECTDLAITCMTCHASYAVRNAIPVMTSDA